MNNHHFNQTGYSSNNQFPSQNHNTSIPPPLPPSHPPPPTLLPSHPPASTVPPFHPPPFTLPPSHPPPFTLPPSHPPPPTLPPSHPPPPTLPPSHPPRPTLPPSHPLPPTLPPSHPPRPTLPPSHPPPPTLPPFPPPPPSSLPQWFPPPSIPNKHPPPTFSNHPLPQPQLHSSHQQPPPLPSPLNSQLPCQEQFSVHGKPAYPPPPMGNPPPNISHQHQTSSSVNLPHAWGCNKANIDTLMHHPPPSTVHPEKENPQEWVDQWTKNKTKFIPPKCDIKIHAIKVQINLAFELVRELENSSRTLGVMVKTVSSKEWNEKCEEIEENKNKLAILLDELNLSEAELKFAREKITKRNKKRARLRRQSERLKKQKMEEKIRQQNLNVQIDNWLREMQERIERAKREEDLKKEADAVLWSVTQKKTEAKRQVAMLAALLNLRSVRVARLTAAGLPVSQSQIDTFNTVIERLKQMWSRHLEECQLEEQALRGMLSGSHPSAPADEVSAHRKLVLGPWEVAILGAPGAADMHLARDELVNIRCSWDKFAVPQSSLLASAVPPGYVLPVPPSSDEWKSFLKY